MESKSGEPDFDDEETVSPDSGRTSRFLKSLGRSATHFPD
jgi:hypothetical protein